MVFFWRSSYGDKGWGCGYRNLQMIISSLLQVTCNDFHSKVGRHPIVKTIKKKKNSIPEHNLLRGIVHCMEFTKSITQCHAEYFTASKASRSCMGTRIRCTGKLLNPLLDSNESINYYYYLIILSSWHSSFRDRNSLAVSSTTLENGSVQLK